MNLSRDHTATIYILLSIIVIVIVFTVYLFSFSGGTVSNINSDWGNFGSYIGGVAGALLSFITIVLLALTLKHQSNSTRISQFESTFFELFKLHKEITNRIEGRVKVSSDQNEVSYEYKGIEYFDSLSTYLKKEFDGINQLEKETNRKFYKNEDTLKAKLKKQIDEVYDELYAGKESELGHYFRSLYHILKFIHESNISNKTKYFDLLQAFLTDSELHIIFYNGIGRHGRKKFLKILDEYSFLENIHPKGQEFNLHFEIFYPRTFKNYSKKPINQIKNN